MKSKSCSEIIQRRQPTARREQLASAGRAVRPRLWSGILAVALTCGLSAVAQEPGLPASWYQRSLNVQACGYGFGQCDESHLSRNEAAQVRAIRHQMNVQACGYGFGQCDESLLSPNEAAQVRAIRHQINVQACGYGFGQCDESLLSPNEAALVRATRHQMNVLAFGHGIRRRNQAKPTPPDSAVVRSTGGADEFFASSYLSPSRMEASAAAPTSIDTQLDAAFKALLTSVGAPAAENGSYYGEPNKNGVPKTVLVNGYTRSNGTYVQGYYRSAPGTNPVR